MSSLVNVRLRFNYSVFLLKCADIFCWITGCFVRNNESMPSFEWKNSHIWVIIMQNVLYLCRHKGNFKKIKNKTHCLTKLVFSTIACLFARSIVISLQRHYISNMSLHRKSDVAIRLHLTCQYVLTCKWCSYASLLWRRVDKQSTKIESFVCEISIMKWHFL